MRYLLVNPPWSFEGSVYFGCREPHLPLEFGYSKALLEAAGHEVLLIDAQMEALSAVEMKAAAGSFHPDFTVLTTAPSYLFWRCAPPELRVPIETADVLREITDTLVIVGPHASTAPRATLTKLDGDVAVLGECEEILPLLAEKGAQTASICYRTNGSFQTNGGSHAANVRDLPALHWNSSLIERHQHHHHRFDAGKSGLGAEMETSRGCPYHCTFCAKDEFRDDFRRRPLSRVMEELDGLIAQGVQYVYFIDEIFLPFPELLDEIATRRIKFGIQTRIDLWSKPLLEKLGQAGCVSIEGGVESLTPEGREALDKRCKLSTEQITDLLIFAKRQVAFVQANLLNSEHDDPGDVGRWREELKQHGVWANEPVPLFPYPGSPEYTRRWGALSDDAWERAHESYLTTFDRFSDIQESRPATLVQLETRP